MPENFQSSSLYFLFPLLWFNYFIDFCCQKWQHHSNWLWLEEHAHAPAHAYTLLDFGSVAVLLQACRLHTEPRL